MSDLLIKGIELPKKGEETIIKVDSYGFAYRADNTQYETEIDGEANPCGCRRSSVLIEVQAGSEPTLYRIFCDGCKRSTHLYKTYSSALREWNFGFVSDDVAEMKG